MLAALQARRATFMRWLGERAYQAASRDRRRGGHARKGAMLDRKAE